MRGKKDGNVTIIDKIVYYICGKGGKKDGNDITHKEDAGGGV